MKPRTIPYGDKNICGRTIERIRKEKGMKQFELAAKMQLLGVDINCSSLSKIEGQSRLITDIELLAVSQALNVEIKELYP